MEEQIEVVLEQRFRRHQQEEDEELEEDETDEGWFEWWDDYYNGWEEPPSSKNYDNEGPGILERYHGTARLLVYVYVHYLEILT